MNRLVVKKSFFDRCTEYIEKSRSHKYIRKLPNSKGGWNYIYAADFKHPLKALLSIFGIKQEKIDNAYEKNDIQKLYGVSKESFASHVLEYLSNRAKWNLFFSDSKTRTAYKAPGKTSGGNKSKNNETSTTGKKEPKQEWNKSLMRKIYSMYNKVPEDNNTNIDESLINTGDKVTMNGRTGVVQSIQNNGMGFVKFDDGGMGRFNLNDLQKLPGNTEKLSEAMLGNDNAKKDAVTVVEDPIAVGYKYNFEGKTWTISGFGPDDAPIMISDGGERIEFDSMAEFDGLYQSGEITNAAENGITEPPTVVENYESSKPNSNTIGGVTMNPDDFEYMIDLVDDVYSELEVMSNGFGRSKWDDKTFPALLANYLKRAPGKIDTVAAILSKHNVDDIADFFLAAKSKYDEMVANGNYYRSTDMGAKPRDLYDVYGKQIPLTYSDINLGLSEDDRNAVYDEMRKEREADGYNGFDADKFESYVNQWKNALSEKTVKEQNMKLLKIYSILEDENWHTENQMLLDGKFDELNQRIKKMRTEENIWKEKNGILDRIKDNKTVGKEYFDHLRATTSNSDTRAAIDQAEKEYNEDQRMAQYRLESDRWDKYQNNYSKERTNFAMRDNFKTKEEVQTALNEELNGWTVTPENLRETVIAADNFDAARQARIDYLQEKLKGFNSTANYGNTFPPSIAGNLPNSVSLDEIIQKVGDSTVADKVVDELVREKTGYNSLWNYQTSYRPDIAENQKWANVQEIVRLQTRKNQGMDVVNGNVVTKVKDINGNSVKEGDIVKISNSYTQNENGLYRVTKLWDRSDGSTFSLQKVKKDGTDAKGNYTSASWPMNYTYSNNPRTRAEYQAHNGKNGENVSIEVVTISDEARQKGIDNATKEKGYQFTQNGIRDPKGNYHSVHYSYGDDGTIWVSSHDYGNTLGFLNTETDKVRNDTDSMTDYFDKDDITVTPSNPYYNQIKRAALKDKVSSMKKRLESAKKDVEKYSGSGKNYYNADYYLKEAKKIVSDYPSQIAGYEKELNAVEKELKPKTVKKSLFIIKNGRFLVRK